MTWTDFGVIQKNCAGLLGELKEKIIKFKIKKLSAISVSRLTYINVIEIFVILFISYRYKMFEYHLQDIFG